MGILIGLDLAGTAFALIKVILECVVWCGRPRAGRVSPQAPTPKGFALEVNLRELAAGQPPTIAVVQPDKAAPPAEDYSALLEAPDGIDFAQMLRDFTAPDPDLSHWTPAFAARVRRLRVALRVANILLALAAVALFAVYILDIVQKYQQDQASPSTSVGYSNAELLPFPVITFCPYPGNSLTFVAALQYTGEVSRSSASRIPVAMDRSCNVCPHGRVVSGL